MKNPTVLTDADHEAWAEYNRLTADGWTYVRATVIWGKAYWWLRRGMGHRLIGSPLRGVTDEALLGLARDLGLPVDADTP